MRHSWTLWLAFAACLAVVLAAMGWVSVTALRLDQAETQGAAAGGVGGERQSGPVAHGFRPGPDARPGERPACVCLSHVSAGGSRLGRASKGKTADSGLAPSPLLSGGLAARAGLLPVRARRPNHLAAGADRGQSAAGGAEVRFAKRQSRRLDRTWTASVRSPTERNCWRCSRKRLPPAAKSQCLPESVRHECCGDPNSSSRRLRRGKAGRLSSSISETRRSCNNCQHHGPGPE